MRLNRLIHAALGAIVIGLCLVSFTQGAQIVELNDNGGWCWYQDERAVITDGKLIVGTVADALGSHGEVRNANIEMTLYDLDDSMPPQRTVLHEHYKYADDHNEPAFLVLPNGHVLSFYTAHASDGQICYRILDSVQSGLWRPEKIINAPGRVTYSNLFYLSAENNGEGRVYDFYRGERAEPHFYYSDDQGQTWIYGGDLLTEGKTPYLKYVSNGIDTIHFVTTDGHPHWTDNSIYHGYIKNGMVYRSDGQAVSQLGKKFDLKKLTKIFDGSAQAIGWTIDIQLDKNGYPYTVFSVNRNLKKVTQQQPIDSGGKKGRVITDDDIRYHYARWDGQKWDQHEIAYAGHSLYARQAAYSGLAALDPHNPDVIYISTQADPVSGKPLVSQGDNQNHFELFQGITSDRGRNWRWEQLTLNSRADNIRPIIPVNPDGRTVLLWLTGKMTTFRDYHLKPLLMINPKPVDMADSQSYRHWSDAEIRAGSIAKNCRPGYIQELVRKTADWQLSHPSKVNIGDWVQGPFVNGLFAVGRMPNNETYIAELFKIGRRENWKVIRTFYIGNDHCTPQTYLEMYDLFGDRAMLEPSRKALDENIAVVSKQDDTLNFSRENRWKWSWCDALYMSPPAFARLAKVTGDKKYLDYLHEWWWKVSDYYYDQEEHLYFRDQNWFKRREPNGQKVFWSRGNGWVVGGLVRVLQYLAPDDPVRSRYEQQLREMCTKLADIQDAEDGLWRSGLLDPEAHTQAETSGSAFFVYGLAYAINEGIIDRDRFVPVVQKAWSGLSQFVKADGRYTGVQPIGDSPKAYDDKYTMPYGVGAFMLAGSEMYRLMRPGWTPATAGDLSLGRSDREYTLSVLRRIIDPVWVPLSQDRLVDVIPHKSWETRQGAIHTSPLQAFGRSLSGAVPWLKLGRGSDPEGQLRGHYIDLAVQCLRNAVNPQARDFMLKKPVHEDVVHIAYLAYPLLVAPELLWDPLTDQEKGWVIEVLKKHRQYKPYENNWLLFSSVIESAIWKLTGECEIGPIEYAVNQHMKWYLGDGTYGDGPQYHWDYYNSFVIHPLLLETLKVCDEKGHPLGKLLDKALGRGRRYAEVLEHLISPEGTYPIMGRSSVYRFAVLSQIGYMGFRWQLPKSIDNGATRSALTTVIRRIAEAPGTFDEKGWLNAGVVGLQEEARDSYNYTGALYFCTLGLSHLGMPGHAGFWREPAGPWFQKRAWSGAPIPNQKPYYDRK